MDATTTASLGGATAISGAVATEAAASLTLNRLIDAYLMNYTGRDKARHYRVGWWRARLGERVVTTLTDEDVFQALEAYASTPARVYAGRDADGKRIYRSKGCARVRQCNCHSLLLCAPLQSVEAKLEGL